MKAEGVAHIEYDPSRFERDVRSVLTESRTRFARTIAGAGEVDGRLRRIENALLSLTDRRQNDLKVLNRDVQSIDTEISGWPKEKVTIRRRIADARRVREEALTEAVWSEYRSSRAARYGVSALISWVGLSVAAGIVLLQEGELPRYSLFVIAVSVLLAFGLAAWRIRRGPSVDRAMDLEMTARSYLRAGLANARSRDPFARLAAVLTLSDGSPGNGSPGNDEIRNWIRTEDNPVVRRELMRSLPSTSETTLTACFMALRDDPDAPYLVEAIVRAFPDALPSEIVSSANERLQTLFALHGSAPWPSPNLVYSLAARRRSEEPTA